MPCVDIRMNVIYILIIRRLNMTIRNIINDFQKKVLTDKMTYAIIQVQ